MINHTPMRPISFIIFSLIREWKFPMRNSQQRIKRRASKLPHLIPRNPRLKSSQQLRPPPLSHRSTSIELSERSGRAARVRYTRVWEMVRRTLSKFSLSRTKRKDKENWRCWCNSCSRYKPAHPTKISYAFMASAKKARTSSAMAE